MLKKNQLFTLIVVLLLTFLPQTALAAPSDHTPYGLQTSLIEPDETHPYGSALLTFKIDSLPRSDSAANRYIVIEKKIGASGAWTGVTETSADEFLDYYQRSPGVFEYQQLWNEDYAWDAGIPISFRVKVALYDETFSLTGESGWSNIATMGVQGSGWAVPELEKAMNYGLIPAVLSGKDLTQPITREEFCELALLLYEKTTGKTPAPYSPNPFTDTSNPQILKAFALGITKGTSATTFTPSKTINRQECATMLFRTIQAIAPGADYSIAGVPDFPDQKDIDSWAAEGTKYMSKLGIIKGDDRGCFMPKAATTAQQAAGYGTATREAAILMSVRTYDAVPPISPSASATDPDTAGFSGKWTVTDVASGEVMCAMSLTQDGSAVTGTFTDSNQNSSGMSGAVAGRVLTATIDHPFFGEGWTWILTLDGDNDSFTGVWTDGAEQSYPVTGSKE